MSKLGIRASVSQLCRACGRVHRCDGHGQCQPRADNDTIWLGSLEFGDGLLSRIDGVDAAVIHRQMPSMIVVRDRFGMDPDASNVGAPGWDHPPPWLRFSAALDLLHRVRDIEFASADMGDTHLDPLLSVSKLQAKGGPAEAGLALAMSERGT